MRNIKPTMWPIVLLLALTLICSLFIGAAPLQETTIDIPDQTDTKTTEEEDTEFFDDAWNAQYINRDITQTGTFEEMYTLAFQNNEGTVKLLKNIVPSAENGFGTDESIFLNHGLLVNKNQNITIDFNSFEIDMTNITGAKSYKFAAITDATSSLTLKGPGGIINYNNPDGTLIYNQGTLNLNSSIYIRNSACDTIINTCKDSSIELTDEVSLENNTVTTATIDLAGQLTINDYTGITITDTNKKGLVLKNDSNVTPEIIVSQNTSKSSVIQLSTPFGAGQVIGPQTALFAENSQVNIFDASSQGCIVTNISGGMVCHHTSPEQVALSAHDKSNNIKMTFADAWNATNRLQNVDIKFLTDVSATTETNAVQSSFGTGPAIDGGHVLVLKSNHTANIDLNQHVLNKNNTQNPNGNMTGMLFRIDSGATLNIQNGTIKGGNGTVAGAIYNKGTINLQNTTVTDNKSTTGGAITNKESGTLTLKNSKIQNNSNTEAKGGSGVINEGIMSITNSSVNENKNGGIYNKGTLSIGGNVSIYNNTAKIGVEMNLDTDEGSFSLSAPIKGIDAIIGLTTTKTEITESHTPTDQLHFSIDNHDELYVIHNSSTNILEITDIPPTELPSEEAQLLDETDTVINEGDFTNMCGLANNTPNSTVKVLKNLTVSNTDPIACDTNDYTIDLNQKTITISKSASSEQAFLIQNKTLTIKDKGLPSVTTTELETLSDTIADSSQTMGTKLTEWAENYTSTDFVNKTITYYTVEMGPSAPVHKKNILNYSKMGQIASSANAKSLFTVNNNGSLNIDGGLYQNVGNTIVTVDSTAGTNGANINNAVLINAKQAVTAKKDTNITSSKIIGVNSFSDYSSEVHAISTTNTAKLTMIDCLIANCYFVNSSVVDIKGPCDITRSDFTHNKNNNTNGTIHVRADNTNINQKIQDSTFGGNYTRSGNGIIFIDGSDSKMNIQGTQCFGGYAKNGAGIYYEPTFGQTTSGIIQNSEICWNYATSAGAGLYEKTKGLSVSNTKIHHNKASVSRGGVMLFNIPENLEFTDVEVYNNTGRGTSGGMLILNVTNMTASNLNVHDNLQTNASADTTTTVGGIWCEGSTLTMNNCQIKNNKATAGKGGGLMVINATVNLNSVEITGNKSNVLPGLYYDVASHMAMRGHMLIENNTTNKTNNQSNTVLEYGNVINVDGVLDSGSKIKATVNNIPASMSKIPVAGGDNASSTAKNFISDDPKYLSYEQSGTIFFAEESSIPEEEFDGVMVQYYINLRRPLMYDSQSPALKIINMVKDALPNNKDASIEPSYIHIDETTGRVKMTTELIPMYKNRIMDTNRITSINAINRFTELDRKGWNLSEIWVKKDGAKQGSTDRADWDIYEYTEPFDITKLNIEDHDVIRLVCDPIESEVDHACNFFDYDVTDGNWYKTKEDAIAQNDPQPMSTLDYTKEHYVNTQDQGINSKDNILNPGTISYQFGNANHGGLHAEDFTLESTEDSKSRKYYFNKFNKDSALGLTTFEGCFFGLVNGYDENGGMKWVNPNMDAPKLFTNEDQIGKTKYNNEEYSLNFFRNGSTYTLQRVNGAGSHAQSLIKFEHPVFNGKPYTTIWTNNFWPMDEAPSAGTDGHDPLEGNENTYKNTKLTTNGSYPSSDDGQNHNAFFGMSTEIKFKLTEDYIAPLRYYFFGDDDLWIFLDGKLIVDIGGIHRSVGAYVDIRDYVPEGDTDQHTMQIFYTERGASGSTCWMQFTMPATVSDAKHDTHMFHKISDLGHDVQGAVFSLYSDPECKNEISNHVSNLTGNVFVTNLTPTETYYLRESSAPEGFAKSDTIYKLVKTDGVWNMSDINDPTDTNVTDVVNKETKDYPILPDAGGTGPLPYFIAGTLLLVISITTVIRKQRKKCK